MIGASTGGIRAVSRVLSELPTDLELSVVVVLHLGEDGGEHIAELFARACDLPVRTAEEKLALEPGTVYVGPPRYHLLVEQDETFSLSLDARVNHSRPSIDVLFESAADAWRERLVGILLTGANADGAAGTKRIRERGGYVIVQDPEEAEAACMPRAAIEAGAAHEVLPLDEIGARLGTLTRPGPGGRRPQSLEGGTG